MKTALLFVALLLCRCSAVAQNIYGSSTIDIDPSTNSGTADCDTDLDADSDDSYYSAAVDCVVTDSNGSVIATGFYSDDNDLQGYAEVSLTFSATPGETYTVTGHHSAMLTTPYDEPQPQPPINQPYYFDEWNFFNYIESPNQPVSNSYDWYGPGPEQHPRRQKLTLPPTKNSQHYPKATITIHFTGSKSPQDQLSFTAQTSNECSESLGLQDCSSSKGWWHWSIEGSYQVSDDASKWTVVQTASAVSETGTDRDSQGNVRNFSVRFGGGPDGPIASFLQQTSGTTTGFWIDSPGVVANVAPDGGTIITLNYVQHYSVQICSTTLQNVRATKAWYINLIANNGTLSATSSASYE